MTRRLAMMLALASLTACDSSERRDLASERESGRYQAAMADYKAGRVDQALAGFRRTCREDPANASARFQLACLLQDSGRDYLGAYCAYQEYLAQCPESDKSSLAKDRALMCEREVAKSLSEKHGLTDTRALTAEIETLRRQLKDTEKRSAKLSDDVALAMQRVAHLLEENAKLKAAIKGESAPEGAFAASAIKDAKALLDEDDTERMKLPGDVGKIRAEREEPDSDRIAHSADIAALRRETETDGRVVRSSDVAVLRRETEADDRVSRSADIAALRKEADRDEDLATTPLLPQHGKTQAPKTLPVVKPEPPAEPPHEKRPQVYIVQDGDTLYKIAVRFYGRSSAWKLVRDANKAVISTDGRVIKGTKIRLPDPK